MLLKVGLVLRSILYIAILICFIQPLVADEPVFDHVFWFPTSAINAPVSTQTYERYFYSSSTQEQETLLRSNYQGKEIIFFLNGQRIRYEQYNREDVLTGLTTYRYEDGYILEMESIQEEYTDNQQYFYDEEGRLIRAEDQINGLLYEYRYDDENRCIERQYIFITEDRTRPGPIDIFEFNEDSQLIAWHEFTSDKELSYSSYYTYDRNGLLSVAEYWNGFMRKELFYNDSNNPVEIHTFYDGILNTIEYITYE